MKNFKKSVLIICTTLLAFSCSKNEISEEGAIPENSTKYYFNEKEVPLKSIDQSEDLIYVYSEPEEVHIFDDDQKYEAYLSKLSNDLPDGDLLKKELQRTIKANRITTQINEIAEQINLSKNNEPTKEIFSLYNDLKNTRDNTLKSNTILGVILWWDSNYLGRSKVTPNTVLRLNRRWRNKTSSFKTIGIGVLTLCDRTFFRGSRRVYFFKDAVPELHSRGFNDRLESYF